MPSYLPYFSLLLILFLAGCIGYDKTSSQVKYITFDEGRGFASKIVKEADSQTFRDIDGQYAVDKAHAYFRGEVIEGADPATFSVIKKWGWSQDGKGVYSATKSIRACDPNSFRFLNNDWQADKQCIYRLGVILPSADPTSFVVLNFWYGKDARNVYYGDRILDGADPQSFIVAPGPCVVCARDIHGCYKSGKISPCVN